MTPQKPESTEKGRTTLEKYLQLRREHPEFIYHGFDITEKGFSYHFSIDETHFYPEWEWSGLLGTNVERETLETLIFSLGMAELVSYWKCACPPKVRVKCGALNEEQIGWWKKLYFNGLGEYFYLNGLHGVTQADFMTVQVRAASATDGGAVEMPLAPRVVVPIGGGKDSVVTWEVLSHTRAEGAAGLLPLILNPRGATLACCAAGGKAENDIAVLNRSLDPRLLELNARGFLNGHTPFSALLAFATLLVAALSGRRYIALSNESSANESTVAGSSVNHQYSKSFEFESDFRNYVARYVSPSFYYFSFLRPLSELAIARVFSDCTAYHAVFKSCNVGSKQDIWCGHCAKCLFAYIIFSPFLPQADLARIFGRNLLADATMLPLLKELDGETPVKPFECVGTVAEVNWALQQLRPMAEAEPGAYPLLDAYFASEAARQPVPDAVWRGLHAPHALPPEFLEGLNRYLQTARIFDRA